VQILSCPSVSLITRESLNAHSCLWTQDLGGYFLDIDGNTTLFGHAWSPLWNGWQQLLGIRTDEFKNKPG